jgi:hypothetical protein
MRARRHRLQVSTFPFLAVLLCAMGALILVLLVMDRRSHLAARARAEREAARQEEESARARAAESQRLREEARAEWERKRAALHARLEGERGDLEGRAKEVRARLSEAEGRVRALREKVARLREQAEGERGRVATGERELGAARKEADERAARAASEAGEKARLEGEAVRLGRALAARKEGRKRDEQTYSVVPYRGKHGEARRPLYVECTAGGWVFHPEGFAVPGSDSSRARAEVERRSARRGEAKPYLLLLVRPDGVQNYYRLQSALRGLGAEYGYEFVDAGWRFDFPEEDEVSRVPGSARAGGAARSAPARAPASLPPARPGGTSAAGGAPGGGQGPGGSPGTPAVALMPARAAAGEGGAEEAPRGVPGIAGVLRPVPSGDGAAGASPGGEPGASDPPELLLPAPAGSAGAGRGDASPGAANPGGAEAEAQGTGRRVGNVSHREGEGPGRARGPRPDPAGRLAPPLPGGERRPLAPAWLHGNRDWVVYVECRPDVVVLYPSRRTFALESLNHSPAHNAFHQAVRQMIARKQASVPRGEAPYRPEVRFLVRPDALQTMYAAHYALEGLAVPRTQQSLERDDDVEAFLVP